MKKAKFSAFTLALVLFLTCMGGVYAAADGDQGIAYNDIIDYNDPNISIIYEGDPIVEEGISTFAACNHTNSYLTGHTVIGYDQDDSVYHVVAYKCNRYCATCGRVVATNVLFETIEKHKGAPCSKCFYDPYA